MRSIITTTACFTALIICTATLFDLASAQNVAGKFAARTKLTDTSSSSNKKKRFWGSRKKIVIEDEEDTEDGECRWTKEGIRKCWWWHLFLAESEIIIKSVGISILCAVMSWLWYLRTEYYVDEEQDVKEENKGGKCKPLGSLLFLANCVLIIYSFISHSILMQLKTLSVIVTSNYKHSSNPWKLVLKDCP